MQFEIYYNTVIFSNKKSLKIRLIILTIMLFDALYIVVNAYAVMRHNLTWLRK